MSTLTVGASGTYRSIASAVSAAEDGDVLKVQAGTYTNDFATISKKITIEGVGGMVHLEATRSPPDGKAILTVNTDATIKNLEFSGARVPDGNGAGIRYQGGDLTVEDSYFHDNQNGILANSSAGGTITIRDSEFRHNGTGDGRTHNIYVNTIDKLTIEDSWFHDAVTGHQIKSRALETVVTDSRITDDGGNGSYSIDLPNGGKALIADNEIQQGARSGNPAIIHFGGEGDPRPGSSLTITGNTVVNEMDSPSAALLLNQTSVVAKVSGGEVYGLASSDLVKGSAVVSAVTTLASKPLLDLTHPFGDDAPAPTPQKPTVPDGSGTGGSDGSGGNDTVTLTKPVQGGAVDLGGGEDHLILSSDGPNALTVSHTETITGGGSADSVVLGTTLASGTVGLSAGDDRLVLASGRNDVEVFSVETVVGGAGDDRIAITGPGGRLEGGAGADTLTGGANADQLYGGSGGDVLTGNGGVDRFIYKAASDAAVGTGERITDFDARGDVLVFGGLLKGDFEFRGAAAFTGDGHSEARFVDGTDQLTVDVNGDGTADMQMTLSGVKLASLSESDFLWV
ncbi:NosD domain-containing protein [Roseomonas sp. CCTCC AB2023176]|uniref:NosD domain-containing protein n=1 Tax=Roseomonas sp. CCTCC AB2023176 TaxID=3342640 RepID=UPI0035DF91DC